MKTETPSEEGDWIQGYMESNTSNGSTKAITAYGGCRFMVLGNVVDHCTNGNALKEDNSFEINASGTCKPKCTK